MNEKNEIATSSYLSVKEAVNAYFAWKNANKISFFTLF